MDTVVVVRLADQAALASVLDALYELHLPVVSAECWKPVDEGEGV